MTDITTPDTGLDKYEVRIAYLLNGYIRHNLTIAEHDELDEWVSANMVNQRVFEVMTEGLMELHIGY